MKRGHTVFDVLAPLVISDACLQNTARCLLPADVAEGCGLRVCCILFDVYRTFPHQNLWILNSGGSPNR